LANYSERHAVLVADECGVSGRLHLKELLSGAKDRVRVITIDNSDKLPLSESPQPWLKKIPQESMVTILELNYPSVPLERRRAYSDLAGGFVRLAADLCNNDGVISSAGNVGPMLGSVRDYLKSRLTEYQMNVLQALSLVTNVGKGSTTILVSLAEEEGFSMSRQKLSHKLVLKLLGIVGLKLTLKIS
jgi:hypothetical protein